jgi:hypothetical protein
MTPQELQVSLEQLEKDYEEKRKNVIKEYALSNNPYKVDDIIEDHAERIKITKILISVNSKCCVYEGVRLKKDGTPYKNNTNSRIFQHNITTTSPKP